MTQETGHNATRDPRTGRPILPLDAENDRKAKDDKTNVVGNPQHAIDNDETDNDLVIDKEEDVPGGEDDDENEDEEERSHLLFSEETNSISGPDLEEDEENPINRKI
jgi:hypothetical protein